MKETLDFSFWQRNKLLQFFYLFSSAVRILLNFRFICFPGFLSFMAIFCFINPDDFSAPINPNYRWSTVLKRSVGYWAFDMTRTSYKTTPQQLFVAAGTCLTNRCLADVEGYTDRPTDSTLLRHGSHRKRHPQQFFCCCVYSLPRERVYLAVA
jgi:hypothetical protein